MKKLILTFLFLTPFYASADYLTNYCSKDISGDTAKGDCAKIIKGGFFEQKALKVCDWYIDKDTDKLKCLKAIRNKTFTQDEVNLAAKIRIDSALLEYLEANGVLHPDKHKYRCSQAYDIVLYEMRRYRYDMYERNNGAAYVSSAVLFPVMISKEISISVNTHNLDTYEEVMTLLKVAQTNEESMALYDLLEDVNENAETQQTLDQVRQLILELDSKKLFCQESEGLATYDELVDLMVKIIAIREK